MNFERLRRRVEDANENRSEKAVIIDSVFKDVILGTPSSRLYKPGEIEYFRDLGEGTYEIKGVLEPSDIALETLSDEELAKYNFTVVAKKEGENIWIDKYIETGY